MKKSKARKSTPTVKPLVGFGVSQERLVKALVGLRHAHCAYQRKDREERPPLCDCKYGADRNVLVKPWPTGEQGNGCPELAQAATLIAALTGREFQELCHLSGIGIR